MSAPFEDTPIYTLENLFNYANTVSENIYGDGVILVILMVTYLTLRKNHDYSESMVGAGVLGTIISSLFFAGGFVSSFIVFLCIIIAGIGGFLMWVKK